MKNVDKGEISRRKFIGSAAALATGAMFGTNRVSGFPTIIKSFKKPDSKINGVQIGVISYSFRSLPSNAEQVLQYCVNAGISAVELMGNTAEAFAGAPHTSTEPYDWSGPRHKPTPEEIEERKARAKELAVWRASASMDKFTRLRKLYNDAGVDIYAWKPNALGENNTDAEIDYALRVAKELGASHVTVELPKDPAQSKRLGEFAEKYKVGIGYHGHLQQTFTAWDEALAQSKYNGLNCDIGHYVAAGFDPIPLLKSKHDRIYSMHLKDRKSKEHGGDNMPWGQGDTPITSVLRLMRKENYKFPATIELEYPVPEGSGAVAEVGKCLEYCRKALEKGM